ncbi:MAG: sigma-54-dependent Fis family transcriptional regulator [Deltaproteobacteria bacterium]|nr:sigma-54-dependent Fis family transcriptional regulator [Deltaproteobacteria bacterium]
MVNNKILIVDSDYSVRSSLSESLLKQGYEVASLSSGEDCLRKLRKDDFDLILLDIDFPGTDGIETLIRIKEKNPETAVIMVSAVGALETAVEAMKQGAFHYLSKPCNQEELFLLVRKALQSLEVDRKLAGLELMRGQSSGIKNIIGESSQLKEVLSLVERVAQSDSSTVLIQGESGTGKELVAKAIHFESQRADQPFLAINCSAVPSNLLESELMGYEKGSFTDARTRKKGLFEIADGGTLFLDEIGEMDILMQAKLLRLLEERSFRRIGGTTNIHVDVRIVSATNQNLLKAVEEKRFRKDLFYRLNVLPLVIPPLRDRKEDVLPLINHFIAHFNREMRRNVQGLSTLAEKFLVEYEWPGNVRELRNVVERAMILEDSREIMLEHLPREIIEKTGGARSGALNFKIPAEGVDIEDVERELIRQALELSKGNQSHAARKLHLGIDAFRYRMKKFGFL